MAYMVYVKFFTTINHLVHVKEMISNSCIRNGAVVIIWQLELQLPVQLVPITTKGVSSNPVQGEVYSIQHYVIKFDSDLQQVGGFLWVLRFPTPKKNYRYDITEILLKVAISTINHIYQKLQICLKLNRAEITR